MTDQVHGYKHGDRVRDKRDGATGTVHLNEITDPEDIADRDGATVIAEVRWDRCCVHDELDLALPHITRL